MRSIRRVATILSNFGVVVRRWETPICNVDWTVIKKRHMVAQTVLDTEKRALRKLGRIHDLVKLIGDHE